MSDTKSGAGPAQGVESGRIDALSPEERRALLGRMLRERRAERRERPVSFAQRRLWFLDQLVADGSFYNSPVAIRLSGDLDLAALTRSLNEILARHEVLRSWFEVRDGEPLQVVGDVRQLEPELVDLSSLPEADRDEAARQLVLELCRRPFELARGPLLRARIARLGEREHVLLLSVHHIVYDGWSNDVLLRELVALHEAFAAGQPSPLAPLPMQYGDYAAWQQDWLRGEVLERQLDHWRGALAGAAVLELPTDHPRPPQARYEGKKVWAQVPPATSERLEALGREEGATLFMTVLAALEVLLSRYSGLDDVVVGTPIAGRSRAETEGLIGCFINSLVLRTDLSGDPTFRELLRRVRGVCLDAFDHGDLPFEKLVEELQPERDLSRNPLFQVLFSLQSGASAEVRPRAGGLTLGALDLDSGATRFDLEVYAARMQEGLRFMLNYRVDLFELETIERMLEHLKTLLEGIASDPDRRISELPLLADEERRQLLEAWNDTAAEAPQERCVHELVRAQAMRTPTAIAVVAGDDQLTYAELERRAARLAGQLETLGVRPGDVVGVHLKRGVDMVVALLAALSAGAAYLPLDPAHPRERLGFMLSDAAPRVLLTTSDLCADLPEHGAQVLSLDAVRDQVAAGDVIEPSSGVGPEDLAYVIYTSGSTGVPKGVQVPHRAVVNLLASMAREPGLGAGDVLLSVTTLSFDISVLELFLPLSVGARVVLAGREEAADAARLAALLDECGATVMQATPATWQLLLEGGWSGSERLAALCGGEAWSRALADALLPRCRSLWNMYGPTETTVWSAVCRVEPGAEPIAIGRPIANTKFYVLDESRRPVPIGVPGELYIGGAGLARGYRGRPELTAERFVESPFSGEESERLYRTGDRVRYRTDGTLAFLGRLDHQVKLRGFRIELGEIEAALSRHTAVSEAVVALREDRRGDARLVAYVVTRDGAAVPSAELRELLRQSLPEYMVPATTVFLDALPLNPSGKVDRKALPAPDLDRSDRGAEWVAPQGPVEELLAGIWSSVLGVERVGARDGFFELGGHSLLATQVASRVRDVFGVELPLLDLFEHPRVRDLAPRIEELRRDDAAEVGPPIGRVSRDGPLPLSFGQQRFWFLEQLQPGSGALNMHVALRLSGRLDAGALRRALTEIVRRHEVLRTSFPEGTEGQPSQRIADPAPLEVAEVDLGSHAGAEQEAELRRLASEAARAPFDIARGPVLRAQLARLSDEDHVLLLTVHHMVSDAWSMGVLWGELVALYSAFTAGEESPLDELPIQYADFAHWQQAWLGDGRLNEQLAYWSEQLAGAPPLLALPTDRPRPAIETFDGARRSHAFEASLSANLKAFAAGRSSTLFMALLAGFKALLLRYTGQADIVVATPVAGRTRVETEDLIGLFINALVLRTDLSGDPGFGELVERVRDVSLGAFAHQDLPFEHLVQELDPTRDLSRHPVYQVMFVLQNAPRESTQLPGLGLQPLETDLTTSQVDLTLFAWESGGRLGLQADYKRALFDGATIARLLRHLERLLEEAIADPERPLSELPLLTDEERGRVLEEWNATEVELAGDETLHGLVAAQTARTPDAVAVVFEGEELTYRELGRRADELAGRLVAAGVHPGDRVAFCLERSLSMLVAPLGILKTGAAYLPLDPTHPAERIEFILADAGAKALVTQRELVERLPAGGAAVVCVEADGSVPAGERSERADVPPVAPDDLAYVIYTSGSTGRPKGVEIQHRAVVNFLHSMQREPGITPDDVLLSVTTPSFDISVLELFLPLTVGARVVLVPSAATSDGLLLDAKLRESRATIMQATPTTWSLLLEVRWPGDRRLSALVGGEAWSRRLADALLPRVGALWNMYGPTETTIWSAVQRIEPGEDPIAIGPPIANTRLYVLDEHRRPVPLGVPGELCIGGAGLARGYLDRAELTAERFVADPFDATPGARLYRTGDLVRHRPDGTLQFLGRLDHQVKVAGFRIELGEIEAALSRYASVRDCVVVAREFGADDVRLVGYVVPDPETAPAQRDLQEHLRETLPEYMVPAIFVSLDALPRTPNGKIDRKALPVPDRARLETGQPHLPPSTDTEQRLAAIWKELLSIEEISARDNFFDLGGHSLLAMRVVARLESATGVRINPGELILQTLGQVAAVCDAQDRAAAVSAQPGAPGTPAVLEARGERGQTADLRGRMLKRLRSLWTRGGGDAR